MTTSHFMKAALEEAQKAKAAGEVPVGAVIIHETKIIARAHNHVIRHKDPTAHAEMLVIRAAAQILQNERLQNCDLYVTLEPCPMCLAAISHARIKRLYYGADDLKSGGISASAGLVHAPSLHHKSEIYDGICESECQQILRDFFAELRAC